MNAILVLLSRFRELFKRLWAAYALFLAFLWDRYPALLYGTSLLLGTLFFLQTPYALLPLPLLLHPKKLLLVLFCFLMPMGLLYHRYSFPPSGSMVSGTFYIDTVHRGQRPPYLWSYRGVLGTGWGKIKGSFSSPLRHPIDTAYHLSGRAVTKNGLTYSIKGTAASLEPVPLTFSLAEWRYHAKEWVKRYIDSHFTHPRTATFLKNIITGESEDPLLAHDFSLLGLSHILAISGFHFSLLTATLYLLFSRFLSYRQTACFVIALLTLYWLFLGNSPSVCRAWITATLFLAGHLIGKPSDPLNALGVALLGTLSLDPFAATTLSFQLSFLATAGILLGYTPCQRLLSLWIPSLPFTETRARSLLWKQGYLLIIGIRNGLALTLSVHLLLLPLLLHAFHTFSLNSLVYNLFFPLGAAVGLLLFLAGVVTGGLLHPITAWYHYHLLALTEAPPWLFKTGYYEPLPPLYVTLYLSLLLFALLVVTHKRSGLPLSTGKHLDKKH